jgi:hypothetical protein
MITMNPTRAVKSSLTTSPFQYDLPIAESHPNCRALARAVMRQSVNVPNPGIPIRPLRLLQLPNLVRRHFVHEPKSSGRRRA